LIQLICLFTTEPNIDATITRIVSTYEVTLKRIFILSIENSEELACSFNVEKGNVNKQLPGALLMHRKKETNTLYTINSLNLLIKKENNGILNNQYVVDWSKFTNSMLLTSNNELKILKTTVYQIVKL
jgi:hypothetical protein